MIRPLVIVSVFIGFDIITGILKAFKAGKIDSSILRNGLFHKLSELIVVFGSILFQKYSLSDFGLSFPLTDVVVTYICIMEMISSIENICEINPSLFALFKPYLNKLKGDDKDDEKRD